MLAPTAEGQDLLAGDAGGVDLGVAGDGKDVLSFEYNGLLFQNYYGRALGHASVRCKRQTKAFAGRRCKIKIYSLSKHPLSAGNKKNPYSSESAAPADMRSEGAL